jgi:outer membrane protein assembly factor BamB
MRSIIDFLLAAILLLGSAFAGQDGAMQNSSAAGWARYKNDALTGARSAFPAAQTGDKRGSLPPDTDWFTVAGNYARTSWVSSEVPGFQAPEWFLPIPAYISQHIQPIATKDAAGADTIYIAAADGLYAIDPAAVKFDPKTRETTAGVKWHYQTDMPAGNSPTVVEGVAYLPGMDKKIHAIKDNGAAYQLAWASPEAGAGFQSNPIVIPAAGSEPGKVIAGSRDGAVYAFRLDTGALIWKYQTGGAIFQSLAYDDGVIYTASNDMHAYAINAATGALVWQSDANPETPAKDKFPGAMFQSYWPVVYRYNQDKYVIFVRVFDVNQTLQDSNDLYTLGDVCARNAQKDFAPLRPAQAATQPWMHGFPAMTAAEHSRYLDNAAEKYITAQKADTCAGGSGAVSDSETASRAYRRVYFMVNARDGNEALADLEGSGKADDPIPFTMVGGKGGSPYPPLIGQDHVLYARNNYIASPSIGRGGLVGWVPGSKTFSIPAGDWAIDEPSAYAAGGSYIHHKLMAEREASVFRYTQAPSGEIDYWGQGGDAFLSYRIPELFRRGWHYGYWKSGDQSPLVPFRGKIYGIINNALVQFGSRGAEKQFTGNQSAILESIANKTTGAPITELEGPLKITGVFTHATAAPNGWPTLHQQEAYLDLRPDQAAEAYPSAFFNLFTVVGRPGGMPATRPAGSSLAPALTSTFPGGALTVQASPATPTILIHQTYSSLRLEGHLAGLAYPGAASALTVLTKPASIPGSALEQGWLLVWDTSENHRWFPLVIALENRPTGIAFDSGGITLSYPGAAGHLSLTPYNGMSDPLPGQGPTYYASERGNSVLDRWQAGSVTPTEAARGEAIARLSRVFPTAWSESMRFTAEDAILTRDYTALTKFGFDGGPTPPDTSFLPPMLALAAWENPAITVNGKPLSGNITDPAYPLPLGRWAALDGTASLSMVVSGAAATWAQPEAALPAAALPTPAATSSTATAPAGQDPLAARLAEEIGAMTKAGHLRPYRVYYGILSNLDSRSGEALFQYFHNPADTVITLRESLPLLNGSAQAALGQYIQSESSAYPLTSVIHYGYAQGARREDHLPLPDFELTAAPDQPAETVRWNNATAGWVYSPKSFYALSLNGDRAAFAQVAGKLEDPLAKNLFRVSTPYILNNYLAGYLGYIRLGALANQNTDPQKQAFTRLLIMRLALTNNAASLAQTSFEYGNYEWTVQSFRPDLGEITFHTQQIGTQWSQYTTYGLKYDRIYFRGGVGTGGAYTFTIDFVDLAPEVGAFMRRHVLGKVAEQVAAAERMAPYWFMAHAPEAAGEVTLQPLYDTVALFNAKAYILNEPRASLEKYLDVPAVKTGDLFYIHKLNLILAAPDAPRK